MISSFQTVLIIGSTSGLGEAFARRLHAQGKKVIATGRRRERLAALQQELKGLETRQMDVEDLASLPQHVSELTKTYPDINTVLLMAGIQKSFSFTNPESSTDASIIKEVTTNVTFPMVFTRLITPHLLSLKPTAGNILIVSSGLAFIPSGVYPVYCHTKSAMHSFAVVLRQQMKGTNVNVIEIVPPYVDTVLDLEHRESLKDGAAGKVILLSVEDYMNVTMEKLDGSKVEDLREVGVGRSQAGVDTWRGSFGKILERMGIDA